MRPRRTLLFMPGDDRRKIEKGAGLDVDAVVMDLEDGVALSRKEAGRDVVRHALETFDFGETERLVRINPADSDLYEEDLTTTIDGRPDGYVIAKVESAEQVKRVSAWLAVAERERDWPEGTVRLLAMIETAGGLLSAPDVAAADERLEALIFGAEDFAGQVGATRTVEGREILYARSVVLVAAAASGRQAIDTVYVDLHDLEGLRADAETAAQLGFDGKLAIHPRQVAVLSEIFTPVPEEVDAARRLIEAFEAHQAAGTGVFEYEGKMVDMPMIRAARRVLARAGE